MQRKTAAHIDLGAIRANYAYACTLVPDGNILPVIKADAYGHGLVPVAKALQAQVPAFAVATVEEAVELREAGIGIDLLVLEGATTRAATERAGAHGLVLMVHAESQVDMLPGSGALAWVKVDTGMHRLGVDPGALGDVVGRLQAGGVDVRAICTHLACADELDNDVTRAQLDTFRECTSGYDLPLSIANSAGILAWPESHADWNRPGIMLFGTSPFASDVDATRDLQPAMTFVSEIIAIRELAAGESVGYGRRWTAARPSIIATIAAGYADGYPRHAENGTPVLVGDQVAPLVGAVSMDMITVDITDHTGASIGDPVELWGRSIQVNDVAAHADTIGYQLLTGVTPRVPRIYHNQ
ncbi:MAG: alanine racemase [Woeseiaceae bacterium]